MAQKLIRERHLIQKQQKVREEEERSAEQERRRQAAVRERLSNANRRRRPTVPGLHNGEGDDDDAEDEEEDEDEEGVEDEDGEEVETVGDEEEAEVDEEENEDEEEEVDGEEDNGEEESEAADENEDAESEEAEGSEAAEGSEEGEESEDGDGTDGDDEAEDDEEEEEDENEDNSDDSDEGSTTLYTFVDNPVRWARKRTFTYYKRLAGKMPPPKLKRLGASFLKREGGEVTGSERPNTSQEERPSTSLEERPSTSQKEIPSTSKEERPSMSREERPSRSQEERPSTSQEERPGTSKEERPSTSQEERPSTSQEERPSTSQEERPSTSKEERPSTSHEERPSTSYAYRPEAGSEPGMERVNISEPFKPTTEANSDPSIPFWKRFSYVKDDELEARLKSKEDPHPDPITIRNAYTVSDKSSLALSVDGNNKPKELSSSEEIANITNEEFEKQLALQAQERKPWLKRRLFGQVYSANDPAPIQEENAWQLEEAIRQSILEYQRYIYMHDQQKPSTSRAADEAEAGLLRLAKMAKERAGKAENRQEHMATVAQQESHQTRELVSPDEYVIDMNRYTNMLLNTVARKCEDLQQNSDMNNWLRDRNIDPHMKKFLDCLPTRPPAAYQSASSAPINIQNVVPSLSSVAVDDNVPTPVAFLYRSSTSHISVGESASACNVVDEVAPVKRGRKRKQVPSDDANQSTTKKSNNVDELTITKQPTSTIQPVSLFLNPAAAAKTVPVTQSVGAGKFVFGNWSAIVKQSVTNDNQSAVIQSGSSASKLHTGVTKKRKRSEVEENDRDDDKNRKSRSPSAGPSRKRRHKKEEKSSDDDSEEEKKRKTSRKRKREDESGNSDNNDKEVKKRKWIIINCYTHAYYEIFSRGLFGEKNEKKKRNKNVIHFSLKSFENFPTFICYNIVVFFIVT